MEESGVADTPKTALWKRLIKVPELYLGALLMIFGVLYCSENVVGENAVLVKDAKSSEVLFPILKKTDDNRLFQISFDINSSNPYDLRIIPDDCVRQLTIDGEEISLNGIQGLCDYHKGFVLEKDRIPQTSSNHFELQIQNKGGPAGLDIQVVQEFGTLHRISKALFFILLLLLCAFIFKRLKLGWGVSLILILGISTKLFFSVSLPGPMMFGHDVDGHISYVQYIAENASIPDNEECWTCYHPPVYYTLMAPLCAYSSALNMSGSTILQIASFCFSILILLFGALALRKIFSGKTFYLSLILWTFWPLLTLTATRVGNDQLFYLFHIICLWAGLAYVQNQKSKNIIIASISALLAFWTKSTGTISIALCGLCFILGYFTNGNSLKPRKGEIFAAIILFISIASFLAKAALGDAAMVSNANGLHGGLRVGNGFINFLYIDIQQLIAQPFISPWDDNLGRQYFANYLWKTSLFGEFHLLHKAAGETVAEVVNISSLLLLPYAIRGFWKTKISRSNFILLAQGFLFVAALAWLRFKYPFACSNDFRYILPALLSLIPFISKGITLPKASRKWNILGYLLFTIFVASSTILMMMTAASFE